MTSFAPQGTRWPRVRPLGDRALTIEFGCEISPATHARVMGFAADLERRHQRGALPGVVEWVPAFASLTLHFDDTLEDLASTGEALLQLAADARPLARAATRWGIPVCFAAEFAPDLDRLAEARGLDPAEVIRKMCSTEFRVYMLGFLPGFPYLGGLPAECELPRRATPRRAVPARSLAVAGRMCAVYPWESPGGWHLLGRTPVRLFDLGHPTRPALFSPGDVVRWYAIDPSSYRQLDRQASQGDLPRERFIEAQAEAS